MRIRCTNLHEPFFPSYRSKPILDGEDSLKVYGQQTGPYSKKGIMLSSNRLKQGRDGPRQSYRNCGIRPGTCGNTATVSFMMKIIRLLVP
jgi:hypothetical protein